MKKTKLVDLSEACINTIAKMAIDEGTVFKLKAEQILEDFALRKMQDTAAAVNANNHKKKKQS